MAISCSDRASSELFVSQRKPEESPVKEAALKKLKQDDGQANGTHGPQTDAHKANGEALVAKTAR